MNNEYVIKKIVVSQKPTIEYTYIKLLNKEMLKIKCSCTKKVKPIIYCMECQNMHNKMYKIG